MIRINQLFSESHHVDEKGKVVEDFIEEPVYLNRSAIKMMVRNEEDGVTDIFINNTENSVITVRETPEEILSMPELPERVDWEQRRYEIAKDVLQSLNVSSYIKDAHLFVESAVKQADNLIMALKEEEERQ